MHRTIWTVGHSTRPLAGLIDLLGGSGVEVLVDVRSYPGSRRHPHFNKEELSRTIPAAGVEYVHLADLGGRRRAGKDSPNTAWRHPSFRGYADYMETIGFARAARRLEELAGAARVSIMCSEAVWWRCHRAMISDHLASRSWDVQHIVGVGATRGHTYTQPARITEGRLTYRPATLFDGGL